MRVHVLFTENTKKSIPGWLAGWLDVLLGCTVLEGLLFRPMLYNRVKHKSLYFFFISCPKSPQIQIIPCYCSSRLSFETYTQYITIITMTSSVKKPCATFSGCSRKIQRHQLQVGCWLDGLLGCTLHMSQSQTFKITDCYLIHCIWKFLHEN